MVIEPLDRLAYRRLVKVLNEESVGDNPDAYASNR